MNEFKTGTFGRVAISTLLSVGLMAGTVSIAAAASNPTNQKSHVSAKANAVVSFQGTITTVATGSISVMNAKGVTKDFTTTTTTKVLRAANVKHPATLASGERVIVRALASAPTVATTVNILGVKAKATVAFLGAVTAVATDSISVMNAKGIADTFAITSTTKVLRASNVKHSATLATGERVVVRALVSAPTVATTINILGAKK